MKHVVTAFVLLGVCTVAAEAQDRSHWGAAAGFIPKWETGGSLKDFENLVINEDSLGISGSEFRIGIVRGRRLSGDWGVSFVRRALDKGDTVTQSDGYGCQGGSTGSSAPFILACTGDNSEVTPGDLRITGVEVNKFFSFVTIAERVQIGINIAGGIGKGDGSYSTRSFHTTFTCTFPPGKFPDYGPDSDPCTGGVKSKEVTTPTGTGTEPFGRILNYEKNFIPLGKVEVGVSVIVVPQLKIRLSGGMDYPGMSTVGITGLFFFGSE
ncbi:MAG: hypothetical protein IT184_01890 [Acidobacteria bacterium]|nr:hypothetical protein [Acidobacteriota bacterium]